MRYRIIPQTLLHLVCILRYHDVISVLTKLAAAIDETEDWPNGDVTRTYSLADATLENNLDSWKSNQWVWRSQGNRHLEGIWKGKSKCMGVIQCSSCDQVYRPRTANRTAILEQVSWGCLRGCYRFTLQWIECDAISYLHTQSDGDTLVWQHKGIHIHPRPSLGSTISKSERKALDFVVGRRPDATAHQLRTGDTAPGSVPIGHISPILANPRAARYQVAKSRVRTGIHSSSSKGGLATLHGLGQLLKELKEIFVVASAIHGPTYFIMRTEFMKRCLHEAVNNWLDAESQGPEAARHGFVTDGDSKFFRQGTLLATCVFSSVMKAWIPVLYTWIDGLDTDHHRVHFCHLNSLIKEAAGSRFHPKLLVQVSTHFSSFSFTLLMIM